MASLRSSGTLPIVALAPPNLPRTPAPMNVPVEARGVEHDRRGRLAELQPDAVDAERLADDLAARRGDVQRRLPRRPSSTGPRKRALASTGPPARLTIIAAPIGQIGSRVAPSCSEPV